MPLPRISAIAALTLVLLSTAAHAILSINEPWVRAAAHGRSAEFFVKLRSSEGASLSRVDSFAARRVEMRDGDSPNRLARIELPPDTLVELKAGSFHLRMSGLVRRLKLGEHVPVTLVVRTTDGLQQNVYVNAEVRHRSPSEDEMNPHSHR